MPADNDHTGPPPVACFRVPGVHAGATASSAAESVYARLAGFSTTGAADPARAETRLSADAARLAPVVLRAWSWGRRTSCGARMVVTFSAAG